MSLIIVPTPIGNLKDITLRALEVLQSCDAIICEDSRRAATLLTHYQIKKPLIILNDYQEAKLIPQIIQKLQDGQTLALTSDAGTPLISDPGFKLVRDATTAGIEIDSLPGAVSPIVALTLSSLPPDKFFFLGYFPEKPGGRQKLYQGIKTTSETLPTTFIAFVAPFKIKRILEEMEHFFGDINVVLAKELTKIHQLVKKDSLSNWQSELDRKPPKGEWIMLINLNSSGLKVPGFSASP